MPPDRLTIPAQPNGAIERRDRVVRRGGTGNATSPWGRSLQSVQRPPRLRSVLVPVDGTPAAEHALPFALALARRTEAELTLASVHSAPQAAHEPERLGWRGGGYPDEPLREYLGALALRVTEAGRVRIRSVLLRSYWPDDALCEFGDSEADLVVIAARRRGCWSRALRGCVSAEVARRSQAPVLVVPAVDGPTDLSAEPPLGRVLVPLDGTRRAERALGPAVALAAASAGWCELLHVVRSRPNLVDWSLAHGGPSTGTAAGPGWEAHRYLRGVAGRLRELSVPVSWQVVADERPAAEAIARHAGRTGTDVIALADHGGVGLAGLLGGSLAVRVSQRAHVPVLICRSS